MFTTLHSAALMKMIVRHRNPSLRLPWPLVGACDHTISQEKLATVAVSFTTAGAAVTTSAFKAKFFQGTADRTIEGT
jgi:hypothetical protein